jgi:hypothetical protein
MHNLLITGVVLLVRHEIGMHLQMLIPQLVSVQEAGMSEMALHCQVWLAEHSHTRLLTQAMRLLVARL